MNYVRESDKDRIFSKFVGMMMLAGYQHNTVDRHKYKDMYK